MSKANRTRNKVALFMEQYARQHETLPLIETILESMNHQKGTAIREAYNKLYEEGAFKDILMNAKSANRRAQYEKVVRCSNDSNRSGVREMTKDEIALKAYPAGDLSFQSNGVRWEFLFTVDRSRGPSERDKAQKPWADQFSRYGASLVSGMFKHW